MILQFQAFVHRSVFYGTLSVSCLLGALRYADKSMFLQVMQQEKESLQHELTSLKQQQQHSEVQQSAPAAAPPSDDGVKQELQQVQQRCVTRTLLVRDDNAVSD